MPSLRSVIAAMAPIIAAGGHSVVEPAVFGDEGPGDGPDTKDLGDGGGLKGIADLFESHAPGGEDPAPTVHGQRRRADTVVRPRAPRPWGRLHPAVTVHPDLEAEQAHIDHAYACLDAARADASRLETMVEVGQGGTEQARFERDVIWDTVAARLRTLQLGDASLVFGRIDRAADDVATGSRHQASHHGNGSRGDDQDVDVTAGDAFYIGRVAVADEQREPVVVDWRAPVAEPFYRATGREPMGLLRRRHFATRGRTLLGIEDELFGEATRAIGRARTDGDRRGELTGHGSLIAALETSRTGHLGDIVATIQGEQDEIIRAPLPGVLVVQGGPGTGKTVVALHRAAYLLYTHRFPLGGQGVLVVGPNRLFLGYIEQVLPSLGEAGVELAVLADLLVDGAASVRGYDMPATARVKGDPRMVAVLVKAVQDRRRPLREDLAVGYGLQVLRLSAARSGRIVADARRRARTHNGGRKLVEQAFFDALAAGARQPVDPIEVGDRLRGTPAVREALERMWPVLTPAELLHDLFGSRALLRLAGKGQLTEIEQEAMHRPRRATAGDVVFTNDDVPLLDEARALLGPRPRRGSGKGTRPVTGRTANGVVADDEARTYGHIIVDEAQDLSPMQLRMLGRRSLNGSITIVGDIAQATGAWAHADWDEILALLPEKRPPRRAELTIGYRIPEQNMALAARVLAVAAPDLSPPSSVRGDGDAPRVVRAPATDADEPTRALVDA
ncbi:MAG: UvrD-helicase domain-containing protein, partial [Acidimicrobiia bacterium]|nr:UvrD-helicase domain-containing protein [Acidimicrobiia bacterium]